MTTELHKDKHQESSPRGSSRRLFLKGAALTSVAGLAAPAILSYANIFGRAQAAEGTINFVTYGGFYGDAIKKYLIEPFIAESRIDVSMGVNSTLAGLKLQVASGQVQWDLVEIAAGEFVAGLKENLFEPLDFNIIDAGKVPAFARHDYGIEYALFLNGMGYDRSKIKDEDAPQTWAEFWDTERYPGLRSLSSHISDEPTLEAALLADGAPLDKLYPLDVQRAFASLKKIGKKNIVWQNSNQAPVNFLEQHEGPLAEIASGRVLIANEKGADLGFVYNQLQLAGDYLVVPRGAPNKEAAFHLINFIVNNDQAAANWMKATSYTISNSAAGTLLPQDIADRLPTSPKMAGKYFRKDAQWWGENYGEVTLQFEEFLTSEW